MDKIAESRKLSIVIPLMNEEEGIRNTLDKVVFYANKITSNFEIILVNDGSTDNTLEIIQEYAKMDVRLKVINLIRNFGHMPAISAGYSVAKGYWVITMDGDLQDPPEIIPDLVKMQINSNADVVFGVRKTRTHDSFFKKYSALAYYKFIRKLTGVQILDNAADFKLITKRVLIDLNNLREGGKIYRLLIPWLGYKYENVYFDRGERTSGQTKYKLFQMIGLTLNSIATFTSRPLRFVFWLAVVELVFIFLLLVYVVYGFFKGNNIPGWTSTLITILFISFFQNVSISIVAEYIGRIYQEVKSRPEFIIDDTV